MYKPHVRCRACYWGPPLPHIKAGDNGEKLISVFDLGLQPLANNFVPEESECAGYAPLQVLYCPRCTLAQLSVVVRPEILYSDYAYVTSHSETMFKHFEALTDLLISEMGSALHGKTILEIGSNDGTYLGFLGDKGAKVVGIDPAANLARIAVSKHVPTIVGILDSVTVDAALGRHPEGYDVVIARHVFCHVDDWRVFIRCLQAVTHAGSIVCIEVPWVKDLLENGEFDTVYHEHTSYMSIRAMGSLLENTAFYLHRVDRFDIHGGAIVLTLRRKREQYFVHESVEKFLQQELCTSEAWGHFSVRAARNMAEVSAFISKCYFTQKKVVGYGASAKSTVWINALNLNRKKLSCVVDETPQKQGRLCPGTNIPVVGEYAIAQDLPDYAIVFCWNFRAEVLKKTAAARAKGMRLVFPIPALDIV